jgi:hypothetical protein
MCVCCPLEMKIQIMTKIKKTKSENDWALARTTYRLNSRQIAMAKELGMNPKKFGGLVPSKSEMWKESLGRFIEKCYYKRFKKIRAI